MLFDRQSASVPFFLRPFRVFRTLLLLAAAVLWSWGGTLAAQEADKAAPAKDKGLKVAASEFRVGAGDALRIDVWKEPEVSAQVVIRPDCRITLPLVKEVEVCGMTPLEIQNLMTEKLAKFISTPDVTVVVTGIQSRKIYFLGQVRRTGPMVMLAEWTLVQALNEVGGPSEYSSMKNVEVQREENGKKVRFKFNYKNYLRGDSTEGNIGLKPGDVIYVR